MEDSHFMHVNITDGVSLFGVFDGHGGKLNWNKLNFLTILLQVRVSHFLQPQNSKNCFSTIMNGQIRIMKLPFKKLCTKLTN